MIITQKCGRVNAYIRNGWDKQLHVVDAVHPHQSTTEPIAPLLPGDAWEDIRDDFPSPQQALPFTNAQIVAYFVLCVNTYFFI